MRILIALLAFPLFAQQVDYKQIKNGPSVPAAGYVFAALAPGGTLTAATPATINISQCPLGVSGTDTAHYIYVSGGTGTAEAVLITGGSCTSGAVSGTVIFTPANSHSGAWTIASATSGIQEAVCAMPAGGGKVLAPVSILLNANVSDCGKTSALISVSAGAVISGSGAFLSTTETYLGTPNWSTLNTFATPYEVNTGTFPITGVFGSGLLGSFHSITGAVNVPASATSGFFGSGIGGYAITSSTTMGAVGVYGGGYPNADGTQAWGANFVSSNCKGNSLGSLVTPCHNNGSTNVTAYGTEIDLGLYNRPGGLSPNVRGRGLWVVLSGEATTSNEVDGVEVGAVSAMPWTWGYKLDDGCCSGGFLVGTTATGNTVGSQSISFLSRDAGGVQRQSFILSDSAGNLLFRPGPSAVVAMEDAGGNIGASVQPFGSTPTFRVSNLLTVGTGACTIRTGAGSPAGVVLGNPCDLYLNSSGGATTTLFVKESGAGTSGGWVAK